MHALIAHNDVISGHGLPTRAVWAADRPQAVQRPPQPQGTCRSRVCGRQVCACRRRTLYCGTCAHVPLSRSSPPHHVCRLQAYSNGQLALFKDTHREHFICIAQDPAHAPMQPSRCGSGSLIRSRPSSGRPRGHVSSTCSRRTRCSQAGTTSNLLQCMHVCMISLMDLSRDLLNEEDTAIERMHLAQRKGEAKTVWVLCVGRHVLTSCTGTGRDCHGHAAKHQCVTLQAGTGKTLHMQCMHASYVLLVLRHQGRCRGDPQLQRRVVRGAGRRARRPQTIPLCADYAISGHDARV